MDGEIPSINDEQSSKTAALRVRVTLGMQAIVEVQMSLPRNLRKALRVSSPRKVRRTYGSILEIRKEKLEEFRAGFPSVDPEYQQMFVESLRGHAAYVREDAARRAAHAADDLDRYLVLISQKTAERLEEFINSLQRSNGTVH